MTHHTSQRVRYGADRSVPLQVREGAAPGDVPQPGGPPPNDGGRAGSAPVDAPPNGTGGTGAEARGPGAGRHRRALPPRHARGAVLVPLGRVLATPGALRAFADARATPSDYLARHMAGDWGELGADDRAANDRALERGERLLSAYVLPGGARLWIITEADRGVTTLLRPEDY